MTTEHETIVALADGWTLRSGSTPEYSAGDYVQVCRPDGSEYAYWHHNEWEEDPILVMGAIINAAAGYRPFDDPTESEN